MNAVKLEDGSVTCDPDVVIDKWKRDFQGLYNRSVQLSEADTAFRE